ncbi:MAG TPA: hypothetical protein VLT88_17135 [Desulfosarcina sp.]|nr:hypothetical protein [Desulfosarcina sp.]
MMRYFFLTFLSLVVMVGTADAQRMGGHGGGMKGCGMMGGHGMGGGMMGGHGMGGGMMGGHGGGMHGAMGAYHHWVNAVMMHREALGLSTNQIDRIGALSAGHAQSAITGNAKLRVLDIDYRQAMRKKNVDQKAVEKILKQQADLYYDSQVEGVAVYTQILGLLDAEQKDKLWDVVGSPFPHQWEKDHRGGHYGEPAHQRRYPQPGHHFPAQDENKAAQ